MKFQNPSMHMEWYAQMENPEAICSVNVFDVYRILETNNEKKIVLSTPTRSSHGYEDTCIKHNKKAPTEYNMKSLAANRLSHKTNLGLNS